MEILRLPAEPGNYFGDYLRHLRRQSGLTQEQLAKQAQIATRTLNYWESGKRVPRSVELETVLNVLKSTPQDKKHLFSLLTTRRGVQLARHEVMKEGVGRPSLHDLIGVGDLLRAMRLRRGWTQAHLASQLGIKRTTVTRWENSEHFPADENLERVCLLLLASSEEKYALVSRQLLPPLWQPTMTMEVCMEAVDRFEQEFRHHQAPLLDLYALAPIRQLQLQPPRSPEVLHLLLRVQIIYLTWLCWQRRWGGARALIGSMMDLLSPPLMPDNWWQAALNVASAYMTQTTGDFSIGLRFLTEWLPHIPAEFQPQMWCDMAFYAGDLHQPEAAAYYLAQAEKAMHNETVMTEYHDWYYQVTSAHILTATDRPSEALIHLSNLPNQAAEEFTTIMRWLEALHKAGEHMAVLSKLEQLQLLLGPDGDAIIAGLWRRYPDQPVRPLT